MMLVNNIRECVKQGLEAPEDVFHIILTSVDNVDTDIWDDLMLLLEEARKVSGDFDWLALQTDEGNGVIHLLVRNNCLPVNWWSKYWQKFHKSYNVRRKRVEYNFAEPGHLIKKGFDAMSFYFNNQKDKVRCEMSDSWLKSDTIWTNNINVECEKKRDFDLRNWTCRNCLNFNICNDLYIRIKSSNNIVTLDKWLD